MKKKTAAIYLAAAFAIAAGLAGCSRTAQQPAGSQETAADEQTGAPVPETMDEQTQEVPLEETEQDPVPAERDETGRQTLYPVIRAGYASSMSEDGTVWYATGKYPQVLLRNEGYEALNGALASWNEQVQSQTEQAVEEIGGYAREFLEDPAMPDDMKQQASLPYKSEGSASITRADQDVFSMRYDVSSYTGGAHGNYGVLGYNFDSRTGKELSLEDVISDREALYERLLELLDERYGAGQMLFEGYEETVRDEVFGHEVGGYPMSLTWTLGKDGMTVYFEQYVIAPYAAGLLTVEIPYAGNEGMFQNGGLFTDRKSFAVPVRLYETLYLDRDGAASDELYITEDYGESGYDSQVHIRWNGTETEAFGGYGVSAAYVMRDEKGRNWLYLETLSDNDYRTLSVFDLSQDTPHHVGDCTEGSLYENVPSEPDSFYLTKRLDLLSTYTGFRKFRIGENGMPEADEDFYTIDGEGLAVTTKMEVPAFTGEQMDEPCLIPAEIAVTFLRTDGESWMEMETPDGRLYRVKVDNEWPQSIDGTEIEAYFDNLRFVG